MADYQLYGMNPGKHHLVNVIFHILNTFLLFIFLRKVTHQLWSSVVVAALFALHPLHVESVAWVSERKDVLCAFFWMLTLLAYAWYVQHPKPYRYLLVSLFFALGLMAKPMIITLPFILLLLDCWPFYRFPFIKSAGYSAIHKTSSVHLIWEKIPLFILAAAVGVITMYAMQKSGVTDPLDIYPFYFRFANALISYASYMVKTFWPVDLGLVYPYPAGFPAWNFLISFLVLLSISFGALKTIKTHPYLAVGWFWYLGSLAPGNRSGAARNTGHGGPVYVSSAYRFIHCGRLGYSGDCQTLASKKDRSFNHWPMRVFRSYDFDMDSGRILAK